MSGSFRFVRLVQTCDYVFCGTTKCMQQIDAKAADSQKSEWEGLLENEDDKDKIQSTEGRVSVCDIWKYNHYRLVTKTEQQTPDYLQAYGQIYSEFLHCVDDLFDTLYDGQKQYFDKVWTDQKSIGAYGELYESYMDNICEFMDTYANYKKFQAELVINTMKIGNNYLRGWTDMYGKVLSFWNTQRNS